MTAARGGTGTATRSRTPLLELFEEALRPPELLVELHELEDRVVEQVAALLHRDRLVAWMVVAMVESLVHRYVSSHPGRLDTQAFAAQLTRAVKAYLGGR